MQRLFSSFAHGAPGAGLLLMRVVTGGALLVHALAGVAAGPGAAPIAFQALTGVIGAMVIIGLWTPIVGALATLVALWSAILIPHDAELYVLLGTFGAALALLGPGAWSVDARLFGWKRVEIGDPKRRDTSPS
jgi:hypothetical protein